MASANTLCKKLLGVKSAVVTGHDFYQDSDGLTIFGFMLDQVKGMRTIVHSAIDIAGFTIFRHILPVSGVPLTGAELW